MPGNDEARAKLSKSELLRVCEEFQSERDAAKRDAARAFDERNVALAEARANKDRLDWLNLHKSAAFAPCNTHVARHASRVSIVFHAPPSYFLREAFGNDVREAIDAARRALATPPAGA